MEDSQKSPKAQAFFQSGARWAEPLSLLRELLLLGGLVEDYKWGKPCYTLGGANVAILFTFKDSCAIGFFKGALMKDEQKILVSPGEHSQSMRMVKFTRAEDVSALASDLRNYIAEAIAIEQAGLEVTFQPPAEATVPEEFEAVLKDRADVKAAFDSLTPGRQRAYLLHFSEPKQSATRKSRIEKHLVRILSGKGLSDRD